MSGINELPDPPAKPEDVAELKKRLDALEHPWRARFAALGSLAARKAATVRLPKVTFERAALFALILRVFFPTIIALAPLGLMRGCGVHPKPLPGDTPKVLIAYDESSRYDQDFLSATDAEDVRSYVLANVAKGSEGAPEFRVLDINADMSAEHPGWQEAMKLAKTKQLPVALVNGTLSHYDGPVPKGSKAMVDVLKQCFGEHRLPMLARPPPEAYALGDADLFPKEHARGLIDRDFKVATFYGAPFDIPEMTDEQIEAAITRKNADHSWPDDLREHANKDGGRFPSLDQNGQGFCWCYSTGHSVEYVRAKNGQPYAWLSPHSIACKMNGFRDGGGWGVKSMEYVAAHGIPSATFWPQQSMSQKYDTSATWADAAKHKVTRWIELEPRNARQLATCLCNNVVVVSDFSWWSHSVLSVRLVSWGGGGANLKTRIQNSWSDKWGTNGIGELAGSKAIPDGAVAPRVVAASYQAKSPVGYQMAP